MPKPPVKRLLDEVEHRLAALARNIPEAERERLRTYHGSNVPHLGLAVPVQREALRRGYSFSGLPFEDQLPIWDAVWRAAQYHEVKTQALYYCASRRKPDELRQLWPVVQGWIETVDCWDTSDELSSIYARILEVDALGQVYAVLKSWNKSPNLWKRRQSILTGCGKNQSWGAICRIMTRGSPYSCRDPVPRGDLFRRFAGFSRLWPDSGRGYAFAGTSFVSRTRL